VEISSQPQLKLYRCRAGGELQVQKLGWFTHEKDVITEMSAW